MSSASTPRLDDAGARQRIRESLEESLIVEAAAGTGKTSELVRRIVNVLASGRTSVDRIVAVTFTHKAAGELKLRLRQGLDRVRAQSADPAQTRNLEEALAKLEEASIGTIHSFCAQILRERPVEALVDPAFTELAEAEMTQLYNRAFDGWLQHRLGESSPGLRRILVRLAWREEWDRTPPAEQLKFAGKQLIEWRDFPAPWSRISYGRESEIDHLVSMVKDCASRFNRSFQPVHDLAAWIARAEPAARRDYDTLEALLIKLLKDLKDIKRKGAEDLIKALESFQFSADADLAALVRDEMRGLLERYEEMKRRAGKLDFLDLLILARDLVRGNREVRSYLQNRFSHIFVDEFQDTDPLQAELLLLLACENPDEDDWLKGKPTAGKLFVVGDPKQSIYKFRRADVVLYETIRMRLEGQGVATVHLSKSYRAVRPVQELVNAAFEEEMTGDGGTGQARYVPLEEHAPAIEGQPSVVVLPAPYPYGARNVTKAAVNRCLPDAVGAFAEWLVKESGWKVREGGAFIPVEERHICILFRRFLNFGKDLTRDYTKALEARGIQHLLVGSRSFHDREEIETLRAALSAVEWPSDELSVFGTLRGALFSFSDAVLLQYRDTVGRWYPLAKDGEGPVREALDLLAELHRGRNWRPVQETVHRLLEASRAHAAFALRPAGRQVLANVYRLMDLARAYEAGGGISFRGFVEELTEQVGRADSADAPVLEEGAGGVRLMTVHSAKGLEFPVVILADMTANQAAQKPERHVDPQRQLCAMKLVRCAPVELAQQEAVEHTRELAEGVRVAYVAATRAKDLLVVPAVGDGPVEGWLTPLNKAIYPSRDKYRQAGLAKGCPKFGKTTVLERPPDLLQYEDGSVQPGEHAAQRGSHRVLWFDPAILNLNVEADFNFNTAILEEGGQAAAATARYTEWTRRRGENLAKGSTPSLTVLRATEMLAKPEGFQCSIEMDMLPRESGRPKGPRFGTLVHGALRDADLRGGWNEVIAAVNLHGRLTGNDEEEMEHARKAVMAALAHPLVKRAAAAKACHREMPVIYREPDGRVIEGIMDLVFESGGGWCVVDFKTDEDLPARRQIYEAQVSWYAYALHRITGKSVEGWLLGV